MNKVPLDQMVDIIGAEDTAKLAEQHKWLDQYNVFIKAKNLGVKFGPKDLTYEQVEMFHLINEIIEKQDNKPKGSDKK